MATEKLWAEMCGSQDEHFLSSSSEIARQKIDM